MKALSLFVVLTAMMSSLAFAEDRVEESVSQPNPVLSDVQIALLQEVRQIRGTNLIAWGNAWEQRWFVMVDSDVEQWKEQVCRLEAVQQGSFTWQVQDRRGQIWEGSCEQPMTLHVQPTLIP